jgi:hypothetical protein
LSDIPLVKGFVSRKPIGFQSTSVQDFYKERDRLVSLKKSYDKLVKDDRIFLNFWLPNWKESDTSIVFYFDGFTMGMLATPLPQVVLKYRIVCDEGWSLEKKKESFKDFIEKADDFVKRYTFMLKIKDNLKNKYTENTTFECSFNYQNNKLGSFYLFGHIKNIGNFHFNLLHDGLILFAIDQSISKKVFNINSKKEDKNKWKNFKTIEVSPFTHISTGFDSIYDLIDNSIKHAIQFI